MEQLIPMTRDQEQSVEATLKQIGMQKYLPRFQMMVNGSASPAETLSLLGVAYNIGFSEADEAGRARLRVLQRHINGLGKKE